jgi:Ribosomal protein L23
MNQERLMKILLSPVISEKSTQIGESNNQVAFRVLADATKPEIKAAVELMFKVQVASVNTINVRGKVKRYGRSMAAVVTRVKPMSALHRPRINFAGEAA